MAGGLMVALAGLGLALFRNGVLLGQDAETYLRATPIVSPLYPAGLRLYQFLFGSESFDVLVLIQLGVGLGIVYYLARSLVELFELSELAMIPIAAVLVVPYIGATRIGNAVMTEALAYPLFLLAVRFLLVGLVRRSWRELLSFSLMTAALMLTRRQFAFLYVIQVLALLHLARGHPGRQPWMRLGLSFLLIFAVTYLAEASYVKARTGHFRSVPFTGFQLVNAPIFVSDEEDGVLLEDPLQRRVFERCHAELSERRLLLSTPRLQGEIRLLPLDRFYAAYNEICWHTLLPALRAEGVEDWISVEDATMEISRVLIADNRGPWIQLYRLNVVRGLGGIGLALFLACLGLTSLWALRRGQGRLPLALFYALLLVAGNVLLVALVEPVIPRYTIYTDAILSAVLLVMAFELFGGPAGTRRDASMDPEEAARARSG